MGVQEHQIRGDAYVDQCEERRHHRDEHHSATDGAGPMGQSQSRGGDSDKHGDSPGDGKEDGQRAQVARRWIEQQRSQDQHEHRHPDENDGSCGEAAGYALHHPTLRTCSPRPRRS